MKQAILGSRRFNTDKLADTFPNYLAAGMDINLVGREDVLSSSYEAERTYFVKVVTPRHLKAHRCITWWRNTVFQFSRLGEPFMSFDSPHDMVEYEFHAAKHTHEQHGAVAEPLEYGAVNEKTGALLYEYCPTAGKVEGENKSLKAFEHITKTVRKLHDGGFVHTSIPDHVILTTPHGEPLVTDPTGRVHDNRNALLQGIGYDLTTVLARYTTRVGTLPALQTLGEHYDDVELVAAYHTAAPIQVTVPGTPKWVARHIRSSINEYVSDDAVETYREIIEDNSDVTPPTERTRRALTGQADDGDGHGDNNPPLGDVESIRLSDYPTTPPTRTPESNSVVKDHARSTQLSSDSIGNQYKRQPNHETAATPQNKEAGLLNIFRRLFSKNDDSSHSGERNTDE
jgi:hypothetical protein